MRIYDVAGYHLRGFLKGTDILGMDRSALLREAGIDARAVEDPEVRFPEPVMAQIFLAAERRYEGAEPFSLKLATSVPFGALELVDYVVAACPTVGEGISAHAHHTALCASGFIYRLEPAEAGAMRVEFDHYYGIDLMPRSMLEFAWALMITRFRDYGDPRFRPSLRLKHSPEAPESIYRRVLGDVTFGAERDALYVPRDQWELPNPRRDPMLATLIARHARDVYARMPCAHDFVSSVQNAVADGLRLGDASIERVAEKLGLTPRTLQRRLAEQGQVYKQLVESLRQELATRYLRSTKLSLTEVGYLLAYSEPSAFHRAFRRWTGMTPAEYRATHAQGAAAPSAAAGAEGDFAREQSAS